MENKESIISKQEYAARQQELLKKRRNDKTGYNDTSLPIQAEKQTVKKGTEQKQTKQRRTVSKRNEQKNKPVPENTKEEKKKKMIVSEKMYHYASVSQWFLSICWLHIPIFGFIYALVLAFSRKTPIDKKSFAKGYLLYQILVFILGLTILFVLYKIGLDFFDQMLSLVKQ